MPLFSQFGKNETELLIRFSDFARIFDFIKPHIEILDIIFPSDRFRNIKFPQETTEKLILTHNEIIANTSIVYRLFKANFERI